MRRFIQDPKSSLPLEPLMASPLPLHALKRQRYMPEDHSMTHNELCRNVQKNTEAKAQEDKSVSVRICSTVRRPSAQLGGIKGATTQRLSVTPHSASN